MPRISAIVATTRNWEKLERVLASLHPSVVRDDLEVIAVCGGAAALPTQPLGGITYLIVPEPDLFVARALAVAHASGDVIAVLEDHSVPVEGWARSVACAWAGNEGIDAIVHAATTKHDAGLWEVALFTLTLGPFLGSTGVDRDRLPVPGMLSFRRGLLPADLPPPSGWLEYDLTTKLVSSCPMARDLSATVVHSQPVGWRAPILSFYSGRMFAGSRVGSTGRTRRAELVRLRRDVRTMFQQTVASRRRTHGAIEPTLLACVGVLVVANAVGQLVGLATGSTGRSAQILE